MVVLDPKPGMDLRGVTCLFCLCIKLNYSWRRHWVRQKQPVSGLLIACFRMGASHEWRFPKMVCFCMHLGIWKVGWSRGHVTYFKSVIFAGRDSSRNSVMKPWSSILIPGNYLPKKMFLWRQNHQMYHSRLRPGPLSTSRGYLWGNENIFWKIVTDIFGREIKGKDRIGMKNIRLERKS